MLPYPSEPAVPLCVHASFAPVADVGSAHVWLGVVAPPVVGNSSIKSGVAAELSVAPPTAPTRSTCTRVAVKGVATGGV